MTLFPMVGALKTPRAEMLIAFKCMRVYWFWNSGHGLNTKDKQFSHHLRCLLGSFPSSFAPCKRRACKKWSCNLTIKIFFLPIKLVLHIIDESCSFKIKIVMAIFVCQGEAKSQCRNIWKSWKILCACVSAQQTNEPIVDLPTTGACATTVRRLCSKINEISLIIWMEVW